jgi:hypothetical protein
MSLFGIKVSAKTGPLVDLTLSLTQPPILIVVQLANSSSGCVAHTTGLEAGSIRMARLGIVAASLIVGLVH